MKNGEKLNYEAGPYSFLYRASKNIQVLVCFYKIKILLISQFTAV